jgi:glycine C-acetyltransferase
MPRLRAGDYRCGCAARAASSARGHHELLLRLHDNTRFFRERLREIGFEPLAGEAAIIPIIVGETAFSIEVSRRLLERGVFVTGFGYPVVPEGTARVRVQMSAAHEREQLERALAAFEAVGREIGLLAVAG